MYLPNNPLEPTRTCERCKLRTSSLEDTCFHCEQLSDSELAQLISVHKQSLTASANLGLYFLVAAAIVFIAMLIGFVE